MPQDKMKLLPPSGMKPEELAAATKSINSADAECFMSSDRVIIHDRIKLHNGDCKSFDVFLRLRLLLNPLNCSGDVQALQKRNTDRFDFTGLWTECREVSAAGKLVCIAAPSGEVSAANDKGRHIADLPLIHSGLCVPVACLECGVLPQPSSAAAATCRIDRSACSVRCRASRPYRRPSQASLLHKRAKPDQATTRLCGLTSSHSTRWGSLPSVRR